jgi:hypothetical protein
MARVDDYRGAIELARQELSCEAFEQILERTGFEGQAGVFFRVPFLDRTYHVTYPGFEFAPEPSEGSGADSAEVPLQEQVLILHYMMAPAPRSGRARWVAYREIPGASFYFSAFTKRAIDPLVKVFGTRLAALESAAAKLAGLSIAEGDAGFEFQVFPHIPIRLIVWEGDEEFSAGGNILFDESIGEQLSAEDVAWLAGMVVYRLAALAR